MPTVRFKTYGFEIRSAHGGNSLGFAEIRNKKQDGLSCFLRSPTCTDKIFTAQSLTTAEKFRVTSGRKRLVGIVICGNTV